MDGVKSMLRSSTVGHESAEEPATKSTRTKLLQGAVGFVVMFALLWWVFSRFTTDE